MEDQIPLLFSSTVTGGQWEVGLLLHACTLTDEGSKLLAAPMKNDIHVHVITNIEEATANEVCALQINAAHSFVQNLCRKSGKVWTNLQPDDIASRTSSQCSEDEVSVSRRDLE